MNDRDQFDRAGSYVLGLMSDRERERAEHDLEVDPAFREAVVAVAQRMHVLPDPEPSIGTAADWTAVARRLGELPQMRGLPVAPAADPPAADPPAAAPSAIEPSAGTGEAARDSVRPAPGPKPAADPASSRGGGRAYAGYLIAGLVLLMVASFLLAP